MHRFSRRAAMSGAAGLLLDGVPALAQKAKQPASPLAAEWDALGRAVASRNMGAIIRGRLAIGTIYSYPTPEQHPDDRQEALRLLEANFAPDVAQLDRAAAAKSRAVWAGMIMDEPHAITLRQLPRLRQELQLAGQLAAGDPRLEFDIATTAATAALMARDLADADKWLGLGLRTLPRVTPMPARDEASREILRVVLVDQISSFLMLGARFAALRGKPLNAINLMEMSIRTSPSATSDIRTPDAQGRQLPGQLAAAVNRFAAVVHLVVTRAGASLIVTRMDQGTARSTAHEIASATRPSFDDRELQVLHWGDLRHVANAKGFWGGWQGIYQAMDAAGTSAGPTFRRGLPNMAQRFWTHVVRHIVTALTSRGVKQGEKVAIVLPHGLSMFPLRIARDPETGLTLNDMFALCQGPYTASFTQTVPQSADRKGRLVGLFNPTGDLPGADAERALVSALFPANAITELPAGLTGAGFANQVSQSGCSFLYCATHGAFGYANQPGLSLGPRSRLSLADLKTARPALSARLVILSACESAVSPLERLDLEPKSLPHILLGLGAQGVIASLWKVNDDSTALLMHEVMRLHVKEGVDPPLALARAQRWLARASASALVDYLTAIMDADPNRDWSLVATMAARLLAHEGQAAPFAHPYFWGAFTYYGS